jgi:penicillin-binding protein 2
MSTRTVQRRVIEGIAEAPYSNVTVKVDVPRASFNYLKERKDEFPGVDVEKLFLRAYPQKTLGAQLFGTLREISPAELK